MSLHEKRQRRTKTEDEKIRQATFAFRLSEKDLRKAGVSEASITHFFNDLHTLQEQKLSYNLLGKKALIAYLSERTNLVSIDFVADFEEDALEKWFYKRLLQSIQELGMQEALTRLTGEAVPIFMTPKKERPIETPIMPPKPVEVQVEEKQEVPSPPPVQQEPLPLVLEEKQGEVQEEEHEEEDVEITLDDLSDLGFEL